MVSPLFSNASSHGSAGQPGPSCNRKHIHTCAHTDAHIHTSVLNISTNSVSARGSLGLLSSSSGMGVGGGLCCYFSASTSPSLEPLQSWPALQLLCLAKSQVPFQCQCWDHFRSVEKATPSVEACAKIVFTRVPTDLYGIGLRKPQLLPVLSCCHGEAQEPSKLDLKLISISGDGTKCVRWSHTLK